MEIKYKRTYTPAMGKLYTVGELTAMFGYAMEIKDPRTPMREGKLAPGEICMLLFGVTPEEYAWRESAPKQLDELADRMRKQIPADRLIGWIVVDLKGAPVKKQVKPATGESIDGGAFVKALQARAAQQAGPVDAELIACARIQKECRDAGKNVTEDQKIAWLAARRALGAKLAQLEKLWVADDVCTNGRFPAIGIDGRVELFTQAIRARRAQERIQKESGAELWRIRELAHEDVAPFLQKCAVNGLNALRVDNGFAAAELQIADLADVPEAENAALRSMMLREIEYGLRWKLFKDNNAAEPVLRGALESMLTLRNFAWREIGLRSLYVLCVGAGDVNCAVVTEKESGTRMLAVFTDAPRAMAFAARMPGEPRPVKLSFAELSKRAQSCEGMLIDVGELSYRVPKVEFAKLQELSAKPPQIVRIQPPKAAEPTAKPVSGMGDLPDPDKLAPVQAAPASAMGDLPDPDNATPVQKSEPAPEQPEAPAEDEKPESEAPRKGFFKRLFGK